MFCDLLVGLCTFKRTASMLMPIASCAVCYLPFISLLSLQPQRQDCIKDTAVDSSVTAVIAAAAAIRYDLLACESCEMTISQVKKKIEVNSHPFTSFLSTRFFSFFIIRTPTCWMTREFRQKVDPPFHTLPSSSLFRFLFAGQRRMASMPG